ncbi:hypothetical protein ACFOQM_12600 [Paenibacillus sp. GCM10012307]|uniref:Uncharacterized protein n=1 Tax=Paenibacillus roseus TaxID=2798579 RepID=A0A934IZK8_9BACL|nr:hypothetical protein [Paenibacillus roseus]MBJ6362132.1 hypothetical protein [Paenibacillus roseus]
MTGKHALLMDGEQMLLAEQALREKAENSSSEYYRRKLLIEANRFMAARQAFHAATYEQMAAIYLVEEAAHDNL